MRKFTKEDRERGVTSADAIHMTQYETEGPASDKARAAAASPQARQEGELVDLARWFEAEAWSEVSERSWRLASRNRAIVCRNAAATIARLEKEVERLRTAFLSHQPPHTSDECDCDACMLKSANANITRLEKENAEIGELATENERLSKNNRRLVEAIKKVRPRLFHGWAEDHSETLGGILDAALAQQDKKP